jgi:Holliday junction resolvasome RuvABC DNA-binding subunit
LRHWNPHTSAWTKSYSTSEKEMGAYLKVVKLAKSWIKARQEGVNSDLEKLLETKSSPILISTYKQKYALLEILGFARKQLEELLEKIDRNNKYDVDVYNKNAVVM